MQEKNIAEINNAIISLLKKINRKDQQQNMVSDIEELWKLLKNFGKIFPEDIVNQYSEFFDSFEDFLQNCKSIGFLEENMQMMISSLDVYKKYVNILTNILKNVPVAIQRCCIWKQLREKVYVLTAAQTTATG